MGDKPTKPAVSERNKMAPVGFLGLLRWGETMYIFEKGTNTHLIRQDAVPGRRTRAGHLLERWYAGSCLRQVTQDAGKNKKNKNKKMKLLFFSVAECWIRDVNV